MMCINIVNVFLFQIEVIWGELEKETGDDNVSVRVLYIHFIFNPR